ncbi:MAG: hypothetical protein JW982_01060 [Spirochaetes bacterium]|nr:hypothetical protein [Spirochaetota bacterium]
MISEEELAEVKKFIDLRTGMRIQDTSEKSVRRYISDYLKGKNLTLDSYLRLIDTDKCEFHCLINSITINETYFFREYKYFNLLEEVILPKIAEKSFFKKFIMWSAASSIGAEAISLVLLWNSCRSRLNLPDCRVYASDIDQIALDAISKNSFDASLMKEDGSNYHNLIKSNTEIKDKRLVFNTGTMSKIETFNFNLLRGSYSEIRFQPEIIFLRNILTYMDFETKNIVVEKITSLLQPGGFLIVSSSDTPFISNPELNLEEYKNTFYFRKKLPEEKK